MPVKGTSDAPARAADHEHRTVSRVMAVLEAVIANEPKGMRLGDLADAVGAPKSSIHGLARGLIATGHLREGHGRYYQGPAVAVMISGEQALPPRFHSMLVELSSEWNETALLARLVGDSVMNIDVVESDQLIRASPVLRVRRPLWPSSYGKNFLALMDSQKQDAYLRRKYPDPRERERMLQELTEVRETHLAFNREESSSGLFGVSSPITVGNEPVTLAIGLVGPAARTKGYEADLANSVLKAARILAES